VTNALRAEREAHADLLVKIEVEAMRLQLVVRNLVSVHPELASAELKLEDAVYEIHRVRQLAEIGLDRC
jgi:hypothetical protein